MLQRFEEHIASNFSFLRGKKIVVAVSGGLDSVLLTHLFSQLDFDISLAHCNFQLREEESDLDEEFVRNLAEKLSHRLFTTKFDTHTFAKKNKQSTQIAARNLRYQWFDKITKEHQLDYIATAHHADDNLETFLINLTRGTGIEGFTGIPSTNRNLVRPLLIFSRKEILALAKKQKINWREDQSNASTKYTRNKIRHQIIPVLKEINPNLLASFSKTTKYLQGSKQIIDDKIEEITAAIFQKDFVSKITSKKYDNHEVIKININKIKKLSNPKAYLHPLLKAYQFTEWDDVYHLLSAQSGKQIFSKTHRLLKDRDFLLLTQKTEQNSTSINQDTIFYINKNTTEIKSPICMVLKQVGQKIIESNQTICVDIMKLKFPLIIRRWKSGDFFYPTKNGKKKKLSNYFIDHKISILEKENIWVLCNNDAKIIWIVNLKKDSTFQSGEKNIKITTLG